MRRDATRTFAAAALALLALAGPFSRSARGEETVTVENIGEAWYASSPACASPAGCPPVEAPSTTSYPPDTLHVGVTAGFEGARTYLQPDLGLLEGRSVIRGTMALPLSGDPDAGNDNVAAAAIAACLATEPFADGVSGSTDDPPAIDCARSVPVRFDSSRNRFTLDLDPFLDAWRTSSPAFGIALVPAMGQPPTASWRVVFNSRRVSGAPHVTSTVTVMTAATDEGSSVPPTQRPAGPDLAVAPAFGYEPDAFPGGPVAVAAGAVLPQAGAEDQPVALPDVRTTGRGFQYPAILLLPLALLFGAGHLAGVLTTDLAPPPTRRTR